MDDALLRAYRATAYLALPADGPPAEARIGRPSPGMDGLLARLGARSGTFVTAWNPRSRPAPEAENRAAGARLLAEARARGWRALPHRGQGDAGDWPPEEGLLVLDLDRAEALALARRHGQNAVVFCEPGRPAELLAVPWGEGGQAPAAAPTPGAPTPGSRRRSPRATPP